MKKHFPKKIILPLFIAILIPLLSTHAATGIAVDSGSSIDTLPAFLEWFINVFLIGIMGLLAFICLLIGGFTYLSAGADTAKAEKGKKTISAAIIGLILASLAYSFSHILVNALNEVFS